MKGPLIAMSIAAALCAPLVASAAVILEQPDFSQFEQIVGDTPQFFSGASQRTPSLESLFTATGTVRRATVRFDMLDWPTADHQMQAYLYECPLAPDPNLSQCRRVVAKDTALGWEESGVIHPANWDPEGGEFSIDFTHATSFGFQGPDYEGGVPLYPNRGYRLEIVFQPNSYTSKIFGAYSTTTGGFNPFFRLEGDVPTSTPATTTPECTVDCNSNVMFLPGIEGSKLFVAGLLTENSIWLPNSFIGSDLPNLDLNNPEAVNVVFTKPTEIIRTAYQVYDVYAGLEGRMNDIKQQGKINDWAAVAYDWRLDLNNLLDYGAQTSDGNIYYRGAFSSTSSPYIAQELRALAISSRTKRVTIIAHSNGGLLAKMILSRPELAQYVDRVIFIDTPHDGTPQAIGGLLHGFNMALPKEYLPLFLSDADARYLGKTTPMSYNLLPSSAYFQNSNQPVVSFDPATLPEWVQKYGATISTEAGLRQFMTDASRETPEYSNTRLPAITPSSMHQSAATTHAQIDNVNIPNNVEVISISGWGKNTLSSIKYEKLPAIICEIRAIDGSCVAGAIQNQITYEPQLVLDGDGTVVATSQQWTGGPNTQYWINLYDLNEAAGSNYSHANILEVPQAQDLLSRLLTGASTSSLPAYVSTSKPQIGNSFERLLFILHSPLTLGFSDNNGRFSGSRPAGVAFEIPGVEYKRVGEVQWLSVPKSMAGRVVMQGVGSGSFALDVIEKTGDTVFARTTFAAIDSATTTVAQFGVKPTEHPAVQGTLVVDVNGDGNPEKTLRSVNGAIVLPDFDAPEVSITISTSTKDLVLRGLDLSSTTVAKSATTTVITDSSGNKTTVFFQKQYKGNFLTYARMTGINYGTSTAALPTSFLYVWDGNEPISQTVVVDKTFVVQALYDKRNKKTTIVVLKRGVPIQTTTLTGLRVINLESKKGAVYYSW